jgi:uncharacterized protein YbjT (DUF2867 family)
MKTALIAGSTGLIGRQLLQLLIESPLYEKVIAITRQDLVAHPKLVQVKIEFGSITENSGMLKADDVFCCLGTTIAKAGSKEKFRQVDFYYPYLLAKTMHATGAKQYLIVTALGANKSSSIFYNEVKGEVEEAVSAVGFDAVHIFRPSLLLGHRQEKRSGEDTAKLFYKIFGFVIPQKYKAISSLKVANAMLYFATQNKKGTFIHESGELQGF